MTTRNPTRRTSKADVYETITGQIVEALEAGVKPWSCPWTTRAAGLPRRANGEPYRGINVLALWSVATDKGYGSDRWLTYKQAQALGGQVRKGERGSTVVYASAIVRQEIDETTGEEHQERIPYLKKYTVFNTDQIDGLPPEYYPAPADDAPARVVERIETAETFFANTRADIRHGGNQAYYTPAHDYVQMPEIKAFADRGAYYATLAHEVAHWTRHKSRLDRSFGRKRWGDEGYAMEELVAELSAAFTCASLGLAPEGPREDHAQYIASWLKVLNNDKRAVFTAASHAQRATDYLNACQPTEDEAAPTTLAAAA